MSELIFAQTQPKIASEETLCVLEWLWQERYVAEGVEGRHTGLSRQKQCLVPSTPMPLQALLL